MIVRKTAMISGVFSSLCLFTQAQTFDQYFTVGISNEGKHKGMPYVAAGDRSYIIGNQDGNFPDMGGHVKGEMGGLWAHPIKMMDGFWVKIKDIHSGESAWLKDADEFINYPHGNKLVYGKPLVNTSVTRFQFCPDGKPGIIVEYTLKNHAAEARSITLEFAAKTDVSPVWFSKETGVNDASDVVEWNAVQSTFTARDEQHPWHIKWGASQPAVEHLVGDKVFLPEQTIGNGAAASLTYKIALPANGAATIVFVVAGSNRNGKEADAVYQDLQKHHALLLKKKNTSYRVLLERAKITVPDKSLQQAYDWTKINTAWLTRTVPGIGTGLGAGLMEYPWWFGCDNTYAVQGLLATGNIELAKQTLHLLFEQSQKVNGNGRIAHEISTNGTVTNKGNTQETAHFIMCVGRLYEYTGDTSFIREVYPYIRQGIDWLLGEKDQNHNLFPEGYGIMEIRGLNAELIDVAVYTQQALEAATMLASAMNDTGAKARYDSLSVLLKDKINKEYWSNEQSLYCDFYGTTADAISACKGAIEQVQLGERSDTGTARMVTYYQQLKDAVEKMPAASQGWVLNKNWVINTPMETGIAPRERALHSLDVIRKENCGPYGPYLSAAIDRRHMMTIATGVQAVAECRYGRIDEAMWYVGKIVETFGQTLPGSISEMMPDYGCFTQAWTNYGMTVPLVKYVFGVQPDAIHKRILLAPQFPSNWKEGKIEHLPVGDNVFSLSVEKAANTVKYTVIQQKKQWGIVFSTEYEKGSQYYLNGKLLDGKPLLIPMNGGKNELIIKD
ncbi:Protein of unknown function, DUF608 [Chitinophaga ginsengisegetis]|uniref:Alpha-L-rhamnosidase six-hairpin glycosidase domain-containing protein n=1 Tax=Chitinophaga ginsengisegetis TaxID=393003 RepID=A0A1T5NKY2_9BACT|nr:amylo-alpha-1,6-glucosidase [Chitinophaga ginsengisegetis]SKD00873.1 Protein of unknown function, DUF608 [Chitinophaga ginsengisegetis]